MSFVTEQNSQPRTPRRGHGFLLPLGYKSVFSDTQWVYGQGGMTGSLFITLNPNWDPGPVTLTYRLPHRSPSTCVEIRSHSAEQSVNARQWTVTKI